MGEMAAPKSGSARRWPADRADGKPARVFPVSPEKQRARSQALNRFLARRDLLDKLEARRRGVAEAALAERARIRRQKRRRSRRAKEKLLAAKRAQSEKKALRRAPEVE